MGGHPTSNSVRNLLEAVCKCASVVKDSHIVPFDDPQKNLCGFVVYAPSLFPPAEFYVTRSVVMASDQAWRDIMDSPEQRIKLCDLSYLKGILCGGEDGKEGKEEEIINPILSLDIE